MADFVTLSGVKRIISIGGWDFSTSPDTYMIFRDAMQPANRATLVSNVVDFLNEYDIDGVDWDWEYPGEPDSFTFPTIIEIPPASPFPLVITPYYSAPVTDIFGGSTTVIGGTTLSPVTTTITPHPYPTTVVSTTDPGLNTKPTSWTSGKTINPSATGTSDRGSSCWPFCDPNCPLCPPGLGTDSSGGGGGSGGGGDGGDGSSSASDSTTSTSTSISTDSSTETVAGGAGFTGCSFPTTTDDSSDLDALSSSLSSIWYSEVATTTTSMSTSMSSTTTSGPTSTTSESSTITAPPATTLGVEGYAVLDEFPFGGAFVNYWGAIDYTLPNPGKWKCDKIEEYTMSMPGKDGLNSYPATWSFTAAIHGYTSCVYSNPAAPKATEGTLTCPDLPSKVSCPVVTTTGGCVDSGDDLISYIAKFYCLLD
ncbi:hypothetical protein MPDQ_002253 [Monascus purpureus]|uniref:GH18 domain-containing protein n=1 Tax=Monascus purpureus TaxID=5098 RepID=A0A507QZW9_MONPU|nr:hypothetical protein MPDQ_002253 [Monascus purpureus]